MPEPLYFRVEQLTDGRWYITKRADRSPLGDPVTEPFDATRHRAAPLSGDYAADVSTLWLAYQDALARLELSEKELAGLKEKAAKPQAQRSR